MPKQNMQPLLERASETGARSALARLGLDDARAAKDMHPLHELLSNWRDTKRSAQGGDWLGSADGACAVADWADGV